MLPRRRQTSPGPPRYAKGVFTPADAAKFLNDSFALCDPLFNGLTNQNITDMIKMPGRNNTTMERARGTSLINDLTHSNEQYGMIMVYFAMKGLFPPSHQK